MKKKHQKPGPKPDNLQIDGDWQEAVKQAIKKPKPKDGSPSRKKSKS